MQLRLDIHHEITVDNFAGGGGASTGIEQANQRRVDVAINHNAEAIAMHRANHPETEHYCESVWDVDPRNVKPGRPIGLLWLSPDCKHFSKAKGGKPVEKRIRGLAWIALRWAAIRQPRIIMLENVEEFVTWGPLDSTGRPCQKNKGREFSVFCNALARHGYRVEWRELRACDYGAPTIRKRLFLIARRDGQPIVWPAHTHGAGKTAYRTAAECIDWTIPCPSIFERSKPLADATLRRIASGMVRYVFGGNPFGVLTAEGIAAAFIAKHYGGVVGYQPNQPLHTITSVDHHSLVTCRLSKMPDHDERVRAFIVAYYGSDTDGQDLSSPLRTIPTHDRFGLVTVYGEKYAISDIGMRMLQPHELFAAQGFPPDYIIDHGINAHGQRITMTKTAQVRLCGNSVCPPLARAIVAANYRDAMKVAA